MRPYYIRLPHTQILLKYNPTGPGPAVVLNDAVTHWLDQNAQYTWKYGFLEHLDFCFDSNHIARIEFANQEDYLIFCLHWIGTTQHQNDFFD